MLPPIGSQERREMVKQVLEGLGKKPPYTMADYVDAHTLLVQKHEAYTTVEVQDRYIERLEAVLKVTLTDRQKERLRTVVTLHGFLGDIREER